MLKGIQNRELECGCVINNSHGGYCIPCFSPDCEWNDWIKKNDYKKYSKEIGEYNY